MGKFYDFQVKDIYGNPFDLKQFEGKKVLVVNTASECGLTPQFKNLQELYDNTDRKNFEIIGFPSNDFAGQDPGSNAEILNFCQKNYGVAFSMMAKITVIGEEAHPLYKWLCGQTNSEVKWNFHKFLIDEKGEVVRSVDPTILPISPEIVDWI